VTFGAVLLAQKWWLIFYQHC